MTRSTSLLARTRLTRRTLTMLTALSLAAPPIVAGAAQAQAEGNTDRGSPIVRAVRSVTREFRDVGAAVSAGYVSTNTCASGPNEGAMGVHYVNETYIADGEIDVNRPEILVYEPVNGRLQLVAVEFLVLAEQWDAANEGPPALEGHLFHYMGAPNRLRLPANYQLHVWAWKRNEKGLFADYNPDVSCAQFNLMETQQSEMTVQ